MVSAVEFEDYENFNSFQCSFGSAVMSLRRFAMVSQSNLPCIIMMSSSKLIKVPVSIVSLCSIAIPLFAG